ncbi:MAG TPA: carboxypeptidase regulatory-like domain-containing protein, partial [Candidatus Sulfotelmatobacter sp.]|nr:carboxypeptidase regulatory-like domain-containing protein [Candidatus Sulfotelmatobacter sp.]
STGSTASPPPVSSQSGVPDPWRFLLYRFWPPLVGRRKGQRVINWPAVTMRGLRALIISLVMSLLAALALGLMGAGWKSLFLPLAYFVTISLLAGLVLAIRTLRGFALPLEMLPELGASTSASASPPSGSSTTSTLPSSARPGVIWFTLCVLGLIVVGKLLVAPWAGPRALLGAALSALLLVGLLQRAKWAYLLTMASCAFGVLDTAAHATVGIGTHNGLAGLNDWPARLLLAVLVLLLDALVFAPVLLSTHWFFPADYPLPKRRRWLWSTAFATVLAALAGFFNPLSPLRVLGPSLTISGTITDAATGQPIAGALVVEDEDVNTLGRKAPYQAQSDSHGKYSLNTSHEPHRLTAAAAGYQTQSRTLSSNSSPAGLWWGFKVLWQNFQLPATNSQNRVPWLELEAPRTSP